MERNTAEWYEAQYGDPNTSYARMYGKGIPRWAQEENGWNVDFLIAICALNPRYDTVLDLGSGYGYVVDAWERRGFAVTGLEWSRIAAGNSAKPNIICHDARDLSMFRDMEFGVMHSAAFLEHLSMDDMRKVVMEGFRVARVQAHYFGHDPSTDPSHISCMEPEQVFNTFKDWAHDSGASCIVVPNPLLPEFPAFILAHNLPFRLRHLCQLMAMAKAGTRGPADFIEAKVEDRA